MEGKAMKNCQIVSRSGRTFADRAEAGRELALRLLRLKGLRPVILGIPRGGVITAMEMARELGGDVDVIMTHKLRAPGYDELAIGAVTETGKVFLDPKTASLSDDE